VDWVLGRTEGRREHDPETLISIVHTHSLAFEGPRKVVARLHMGSCNVLFEGSFCSIIRTTGPMVRRKKRLGEHS
jgi:hypothetical protein